MTVSPEGDVATGRADGTARLRLNVYDALAANRGATTPTQQARLHGISRAHMYRIRAGERRVRLDLALRMARDLGTSVEVIFERTAA